MDMAVSTIFYPFEKDLLDRPDADIPVAFFNAQFSPALADFQRPFVQQYFKPFANILQDQGYHVSSDLPASEGTYGLVMALLPKNAVEAQYLVARALTSLQEGGLFICAADNKSGGNRLKKMLQNFGLSAVQDASKNKARVAWGRKESLDVKSLEMAVEEGDKQSVLAGEFVSQPGIFGWHKIDKGSEILLQYLPNNLSGRGADFGCGYGYLSRHIVQQNNAVKELLCVDADWRAVKACEENIGDLAADDMALRFFWEDLTASVQGVSDLDFIVMNPPFHEGKTTDSDIGKAFIQTAHDALHIGGKLYMVANAHLPYELVLHDRFTECDRLFEGQGFKIFCAIK